MPTEILSRFVPTPPQRAFLQSTARVKGFGGAMAGGKTKTMCEATLDLLIDYPGIQVVMARQKHTAIIETTKKRMLLVIPPELVHRKKESQGEDWVMTFTSLPGVFSKVNFIGLDDPVKWFSSEIGALVCDEAHEMSEDDVRQLRSRLRQRCAACELGGSADCSHMPLVTMLGFNPENPGHWLRSWFILGAGRTRFGFYKSELYTKDADAPSGDAEFVIAKATDNPYVSKSYIEETLGGMSRFQRRRYLEGEWIFVSGSCFFDDEALEEMNEGLERPKWVAEVCGSLSGDDKDDRIRFRQKRGGPWSVFRVPVREDVDKDVRAHRYIVSVDTSSGGSTDYSGIQVLDVEEFAQVAEYQQKLDPDLVAHEAFRAAVVYNGATIVVEITGGWGFTVIRKIEGLLAAYKGPPGSKPRLYLRRIEDRLAKRFTDKLGWDTTQRTRAFMLDTLEEVIRERSLTIRSERTLAELLTFVRDEKGRPAAQPGCCDDMVTSLAMGVAVYTQQPKTLHRWRPKREDYLVAKTGY